MPSPANLACAVIDLSQRRMPTICTVSFARTYPHAKTLDDLNFDHWFPPTPHSYLREGLSARRLFLTRKGGVQGPLLDNPFTVVGSAAPPRGYINLRSGVAVVVKHAGPDDEALELLNVTIRDLSLISDLLRCLARDQINNGYRCSHPMTDYRYLTVDRRHLVDMQQPS
ncbi:hypothetical protein K435DRAFT_812839, partial [Dendrothele bispora CBS 962.96]